MPDERGKYTPYKRSIEVLLWVSQDRGGQDFFLDDEKKGLLTFKFNDFFASFFKTKADIGLCPKNGCSCRWRTPKSKVCHPRLYPPYGYNPSSASASGFYCSVLPQNDWYIRRRTYDLGHHVDICYFLKIRFLDVKIHPKKNILGLQGVM
uniref:Uncharacterized protein n=1 Tax=Romanomermis culicivorax TaxID=13658 RepID=A0A915I9X7_ROMCU